MAIDFQVTGKNKAALFRLKVHRGDGMCLLAMDWKKGKPPIDFVGFAIEYKEPGGDRFHGVENMLNFLNAEGKVDYSRRSSRLAPFQRFRWVHFPKNADLEGSFTYRVTPVFMNDRNELSYGELQEVSLRLARETHPGKLNVTFTRGFVSSQAFVKYYGNDVSTLLPSKADDGLSFKPTHKKAKEAHAWMGFEARREILQLLDDAITDKKAEVRVVAFDLNEPEILTRLEKLGKRLRIILDDSNKKKEDHSVESQAAARLVKTAGAENVERHHVRALQHNKTIVVNGPKVKAAICGSTNFSWRGLYVQNNHAVIVYGAKAIQPFLDAFDAYWTKTPAKFAATPSAGWTDLGLTGIDAKITFSPRATGDTLRQVIADDLKTTKSSLFYSMAFLYQTPGPIRDAIKHIASNAKTFVYGVSDKAVDELELQKPDGNRDPVYPKELGKGVPPPFSEEPTGGVGNRLHHKFAVIDFDKPTARVYFGSYNFSKAADDQNGENLLLMRDRRVAVSYAIEALRIFDHYSFRVKQHKSETGQGKPFALQTPPRKPGEQPWWTPFYAEHHKIRDRQLFA